VTAASTAHPAVIQYATDAECASTMTPASGEASASPTAIPALGQDIDSVNRDIGTIRSINAIPEISTGATAIPATSAPIASSHTLPSSGNGNVTTAITASIARNCRRIDARSFTAPNTSPPHSDPNE